MIEGKAIILSAPSGSGKTTLVNYLLQTIDTLSFSISACTRERRGKEVDGKDYYFLSADEFREKIQKGEFVEWEEVYHDHYYGTLKSEVERVWRSGKHLIFDVDVIGGLNLKEYFGDRALALFVMPPDLPTLEKRLRGRGTDSEDRIATRLQKAKKELLTADQFDHIILNVELAEAKKEAEGLVKNFLSS
jgi:guanylate kinase